MAADSIIGKTVFYRKPNETELKKSIVVSKRSFNHINGLPAFTLLKLENGDEVAETAAYLES